MLEAEKQQHDNLLKQWYNLLVNAILEGDFGKDEGMPGTFTGLLRDDHLTEIRDIAMRNRLDKQKTSKNDGDYLSFPALKTNLSDTTGIEVLNEVNG